MLEIISILFADLALSCPCNRDRLLSRLYRRTDAVPVSQVSTAEGKAAGRRQQPLLAAPSARRPGRSPRRRRCVDGHSRAAGGHGLALSRRRCDLVRSTDLTGSGQRTRLRPRRCGCIRERHLARSDWPRGLLEYRSRDTRVERTRAQKSVLGPRGVDRVTLVGASRLFVLAAARGQDDPANRALIRRFSPASASYPAIAPRRPMLRLRLFVQSMAALQACITVHASNALTTSKERISY
jgi:hypothetical protein